MTRALTIAVSVVLACLVLGSQVATVAHSLTTRHAICDEHRELVHREATGGAHSNPATDVLTGLPETEHGHGCALLTGLCQTQAAPPAPVAVPAPSPPEVPAPAPPVVEAHASSTLLAFAPKTSPPGRSTTA